MGYRRWRYVVSILQYREYTVDFNLHITDNNHDASSSDALECSSRDRLKTEAVRAVSLIRNWPDYAATPLRSLPGLAQKTSVGRIDIKDEAQRFGLGSFKALGGAYAIFRLIAGRRCETALTVCCATDGNHGRSVAWGAQMFGCDCVVFIHKTVSEERKQSIEHYGARVVRTAGNYDDSVREAQAAAEREGWTVVSDTSYEGYMDIPMDVMAGYSIMTTEAIEQWGDKELPTHVFLQTGVGSMAASVVVQLQQAYGENCPKIVLVDPAEAACWYDSLKAGEPRVVDGDHDTIMAGLACGEVSHLAWELLQHDVAGVMIVDDSVAEQTMRLLAQGNNHDRPLVAGESGVGGLAGFIALAHDEAAREKLGIDGDSRLLFFSTEGATDRKVYQEIVGQTPEQVMLTQGQ